MLVLGGDGSRFLGLGKLIGNGQMWWNGMLFLRWSLNRRHLAWWGRIRGDVNRWW